MELELNFLSSALLLLLYGLLASRFYGGVAGAEKTSLVESPDLRAWFCQLPPRIKLVWRLFSFDDHIPIPAQTQFRVLLPSSFEKEEEECFYEIAKVLLSIQCSCFLHLYTVVVARKVCTATPVAEL